MNLNQLVNFNLLKEDHLSSNSKIYYLPDCFGSAYTLPKQSFLDTIQGHEVANRCYVVIVTSSIDSHDKLKSANYPQVIGIFEKNMNPETCLEIKRLSSLSVFFEAN